MASYPPCTYRKLIHSSSSFVVVVVVVVVVFLGGITQYRSKVVNIFLFQMSYISCLKVVCNYTSSASMHQMMIPFDSSVKRTS